MKTWELHAIFKGRVQGVGFRWTIADHAKESSLVGTVQNLPNGSVEVYAQGPEEALQDFLQRVQKDAGNAQITNLTTHYKQTTLRFQNFLIL